MPKLLKGLPDQGNLRVAEDDLEGNPAAKVPGLIKPAIHPGDKPLVKSFMKDRTETIYVTGNKYGQVSYLQGVGVERRQTPVIKFDSEIFQSQPLKVGYYPT